jgi:rubrerythrin
MSDFSEDAQEAGREAAYARQQTARRARALRDPQEDDDDLWCPVCGKDCGGKCEDGK